MKSGSRFLTLLFLTLFLVNTSAQELSFSGYGSAGFKFTNRNILNGYNQETYYRGKFQADINWNKNLEAQLDFRGTSIDKSVQLREFSLKLKYWEKFRIKIGNIKKPFGFEQLVNRENLPYVDRSLPHNFISEMGYGGREMSLMGYYKYSKKRADFPYSYYVSFSKDNSLSFSATGRFVYHTDFLNYGFSGMFMNQGGEEKINTNGFAVDVTIEKKKYKAGLEIFHVQDPDEGIRRRLQKLDEEVFATGLKLFATYEFDTGTDFIKKIEPVTLITYYMPDNENEDLNYIQAVIGVNLYLHKKVLIRFNGDLRLTKNEFAEDYTSKDSRGIFEVMVKF